MKHLIICREYPPASGGGIGTYVWHISQRLAENGETVHVIGQLWEGAEKELEEKCNGRLIIHRVPFLDWTSFLGSKPNPAIKSKLARELFTSSFFPQCFSWQASLLAERLVEQEGIDIIEGQDYEAPLYYFQLRRALKLGPKKMPPCLVHLHSPTELIVRYNEWNLTHPYYYTAKQLEDYSIAAAEALLCPSHYLARQAEKHYGLAEESTCVIPYPMSDVPAVERSRETWEHGKICYVGRLERRKGVIEWIEAAVTVADDYPAAQFEFVGANFLGKDGRNGFEIVERLIPKPLKKRFHFRGEQPRVALTRFLAQARFAVVPSRWENFPNTCIEAMASGLPVIATREGGMAEMIEDNRSGWLAGKADCNSLAQALRRALEVSPEKIAEMGGQAAARIRQVCDPDKIVERHLAFRAQLAAKGAKRAISLPAHLTNVPFTNGGGSDLALLVGITNSPSSRDRSIPWRDHLAQARLLLRDPNKSAALVLRKIRGKMRRRLSH